MLCLLIPVAADAEPRSHRSPRLYPAGGGPMTRPEPQLERVREPQRPAGRDPLARGGAIGGSSADASLQTKAVLCGGEVNPRLERGLNLLQGATVDPHFPCRNRLPRLADAVRDNPHLVGYGIDEATSLVINEDKMHVVARSYVIRIQVVDSTPRITPSEKRPSCRAPKTNPGEQDRPPQANRPAAAEPRPA